MSGSTGPADQDDVAHLRRAVQRFVAIDSRLGPDGLADAAKGLAASATMRLTAGAYDRRVERDLYAAVGRSTSIGTSWSAAGRSA